MKPILVTSGEPAGIGPDLCLDLLDIGLPIVVLADPSIIQERANIFGKAIIFDEYDINESYRYRSGHLPIWPIYCPINTIPGELNPKAAGYVIEMLDTAARACLDGKAAALVTAPVHKAIINQAGIPFSGHTEFFADLSNSQTVMMLASDRLKVSLVTTHIPLHQVPLAITKERLNTHLTILYHSLQHDFGITHPRIRVLGLNPHAGENGYLGKEELTIIGPVIKDWQQRGMDVNGPFPADTGFLELEDYDVIVAMYHDQGLPVLKFTSFGCAVNISCGLPFIRTSVDHGTALSLAGSGRASSQSLQAAVKLAAQMAKYHV